MKNLTLIFALLPVCIDVFAQESKSKMLDNIAKKEMYYGSIAKKIWNYAEVGYQETRSSALLQETLSKEGFAIQKGVAGIPTAFVASFGEGKPVIGILGEYDALPGLSQDSTTDQKSTGGAAGHACGHHLFGTASAAAAIAVKEYMKANHIKGTIRFYGCPAEEGGSGKVYMVREGLFNDVDAVIHWHPNSINTASFGNSLANKSGKFRFYGVSAHASMAPEKGRSALDGVEAMNNMVNMLREHVPSDSRIHYVITNGGKAPNVVPDFAEVYYYARNPRRDLVMDVWSRIEKAAKGAALGTDTRVEWELTGGTYELLYNETLAQVMQNNLTQIGGLSYTAEEKKFAEQLAKSLGADRLKYEDATDIKPLVNEKGGSGGSTDVGDVSWTVPTVGLSVATWVPGTPAHSWQAVAAGGMSIGRKGMTIAAKTMALTATQLFESPEIIRKAKEEFAKARGEGFKYISLLGDRKPALDYRK
ncbi:amidohydrolase [Emticicia sp. 21SJ11W-3]|uniref:amidohydrolase n=1 Tax=Emticicia sp. 21SJ11W-3 TaxID=2916755 RepID=UPI00209F44C2|nr:amidohydrolase [Emticicia sp. 21SJ11W-3]UTA69872.1 amidohydrolase [Emticicia sp. 21SJ11W-3]